MSKEQGDNSMTAKNFSALLVNMSACSEAVTWSAGKDLKEVWETCPRGDWLLWLAARMIGKEGWHTHQQVVLAACACAETALKHVPEGELRPARCIEVVRLWAYGKATLDEVRMAREEAMSSDAAIYSAAARAIYADAAAAHAADSAAYSAYAAYAAAQTASRQLTADTVRATLTVPTTDRVLATTPAAETGGKA